MKNERTGKAARSIAGRILTTLNDPYFRDTDEIVIRYPADGRGGPKICNLVELKTVCASALTQSPDKPKPKPKSKRK